MTQAVERAARAIWQSLSSDPMREWAVVIPEEYVKAAEAAVLPLIAERDAAVRERDEAIEKADRWVETANASNTDAEVEKKRTDEFRRLWHERGERLTDTEAQRDSLAAAVSELMAAKFPNGIPSDDQLSDAESAALAAIDSTESHG